MSRAAGIALVALALGLVGCSGPRPFKDVDLSVDLASHDLARYERECKEAHAGGAPGSMATLERSDWWLSGLLLYWRKGSVMRAETADGPSYHVATTHGFGPLSVLYVRETHAAFDSKGRRISRMTTGSVGWGHLAMWHASDATLTNGERQQASSIHLAHHAINLHIMDGHTALSLFSAPNVLNVGVRVERRGGHGGH